MSDERANRRLQMLEQKIAAGAQDPFIFYARALELRSLGQLTTALEALTEVEQRFPEYVPTFLMAGQIAAQVGEVERARGFLQRGLAVATGQGDEHARSELQQALDSL